VSERENLPSASAWARYEKCPGSYQLSLKAREIGQEAFAEPSEAAARGLRIHRALAGEQVDLSASEKETVQFLNDLSSSEIKRIFGDAEVKIQHEVRVWIPKPE
jgi:hypothetical protein